MAELTAGGPGRGDGRAPADRPPQAGRPDLGPRAARHGRRLRGAQGGDARTEPGLPGEVRPCLPDLRHRPDRRADARRGHGADRQRAGAGTRDRPHRTGQDQPHPAGPPRRSTREEPDHEHRARTASVSTHILDTSVGRPAEGVAVRSRPAPAATADWTALGGSATDADGRCKDLPALPEGTTHVRLDFEVEAYFVKPRRQQASRGAAGRPRERDSGGVFFPEVAITFAVEPGRALPRTAAAQPVRLLRIPRELA